MLLVTAIGLFITYLFNMDAKITITGLIITVCYSLSIGLTLWNGNAAISDILEKYISWEKEPLKLFLAILLASLVYTSCATILIDAIFNFVIFNLNFKLFIQNVKSSIFIEIGITFFIMTIIYSIEFFKAWQLSIKNEELLKRQAVELQYQALRNQVNPHFLFNSLNVLTSIVYTDQDLAVKFIKQLSDVYRYVLEQKENNLIDLETEMQFVEKYIYLQKIRHNDGLKVNINLSSTKNLKVIPVSVQILVENAIKHNIVSPDEPLQIDIYSNGDNYLIIKNNLQLKTSVEDSTNTGLANIKAQYEHLTNKNFEIIKDANYFTVKIPLIN